MEPVHTNPLSERFQKGAMAILVSACGRLFTANARMVNVRSLTRQTRGGSGKTLPFNSAHFPSALL
jgi:hypothetical protein